MRHITSMFSLSNQIIPQLLTVGKLCAGHSSSPPSSSASLAQKNPPPLAEGNSVVRPNCISPHPCTQTTHPDRSGMKRRVDDEEGELNKKSHLSKRFKSALDHRQHKHAAPTNSSRSSQDCDNYTRASTALRNHLNTTLHSATDAHPTRRNQTQSSVRSSIKRRMADGEDTDHQKSKTQYYERSDRKKFQDALPIHPPQATAARPRFCVSPRVKRKMALSLTLSLTTTRGQIMRKRGPEKWHAGRSTSSSRHVPSDRRSRPAKHHHHSAHPSCRTQTESRAQSELKRKASDENVRPRKIASYPLSPGEIMTKRDAQRAAAEDVRQGTLGGCYILYPAGYDVYDM
ncbi:uncharacterized protein LOC130183981 [Seriola aureovittata]|uniref:uncharacterized protein LOC130183981 n=1 Tax=Seriola aureovittata TaxID=2871759 RepID=UPI0024BE19D8|nr:uncharacterized protein LOC130183981 [Seriola aureovittata]